jgi:hypothetical protein
VNIEAVQGTTCSQSNGSVTGSSSSNYSTTNFYLYDSEDIYIMSATTSVNYVIFDTLLPGRYYIKVVDFGGCTGYSQNFIIEESDVLDFGLYMVPNSSCGGAPIGKIFITGVTGTPPYIYNWSNGATGSTITGLTSGQYSVSITDSSGCIQTRNTTVTDVPPIGLGIFTAIPPTCFQADGSLTIQVTGGTIPYYFSASTGEVAIQYGTSWTLSGLSAGDYYFQVTDAALCTFIAGSSLLSPQGMSSVSVNTNGSTCSSTDGSIQVSVIGGVTPYTYTLIYPNGNTTNIPSSQTVVIFSNLSSGTYSVVVQDSSSCSYIEEVTLVATDTFTISANTTGTTCNQNNGSVLVTRTEGGVGPYDFSLDGIQNVLNTNLSAVTFSNVSSGQHTISVTDDAGCVQTGNVFVNGSIPLDFTLYSTSCGSGSGGILTALITSGTPPFTFNWSTNVPGNPQDIKVSGLSADTYTLSITDSLGCVLQRSTTINCDKLYTSYQTYVMGGEDFIIQTQSKFGLNQMLYDGFLDLTSNRENCRLNESIFGINIFVNPNGFTTSQSFFTGTTLTSVPTDTLYLNTLKSLLLTVPGVGDVTINEENNQIIVSTIPWDETLNNQELIVKLTIEYDILCECPTTYSFTGCCEQSYWDGGERIYYEINIQTSETFNIGGIYYIETDIYSGCVTNVIYNSLYPIYDYVPNSKIDNNYQSCEECSTPSTQKCPNYFFGSFSACSGNTVFTLIIPYDTPTPPILMGSENWYVETDSFSGCVTGVYYNPTYPIYNQIGNATFFDTCDECQTINSECSIIVNTDTPEVYSYDFQSGGVGFLNQYFDTSLPLSDDVAHTNNKMWLYDGSSLYEYNITINPFIGVENRIYSISSLGPGLCAKNDTTLISSIGNVIGEVTLAGSSATFIPKFNLPSNREITGDIILTTNNKLITSNYNINTDVEYITQQDYITGAVEVDIQLSGIFGVFGLFIDNNNIYFTTEGGQVYLIDKTSPYNFTYQTNNGLVNFGASQIPSCCNVSFT